MRDVALVWFESASPGSAAGQHLTGTVQRLTNEDVPIRTVVASSEEARGWAARLRRLTTVQILAVGAGGRKTLLLVRWHPASLLPLAVQRLRGGRSVLLVQGNVADMHSAYPVTAHLPLEALVLRRSLALGDVHVAPSQGILEWISRDMGVSTPRSFVIENGFDDEALIDLPPLTDRELGEVGVQRHRYAVFVGKFARWQGIDTILQAVDSAAWPVDLPIVFVGDGAGASAVNAASRRTPLVRCVGRVPPHKALAWTQSAAIALAPRKSGPASDRGVSPYKVLEAAALGTPLVATRVRGQEELVDSLGAGLLVSPDSHQELAESVAELWRNPDLRLKLSRVGAGNAEKYAWRSRSQELRTALEHADWSRQ